jgi:UPF0716 protein FxsA
MLRNWPVLFVVIPLVELYLIIKVGSLIGALWTVILVLLTAVIGVQLLRFQGFSTLNRARRSMEMGQLPAMEMMEGMALAVGGALLITPGFLTDTLGFLCLVPATRRAMIRWIMRHGNVQAGVHVSGAGFGRGYSGGGRSRHGDGVQREDPSAQRGGRVIEGEYDRKD